MSFNKFFGQRRDAPITDDADQVPTPIGKECLWCNRPIVDGDQGFLRMCMLGANMASVMRPAHRGCEMATTIGHLYGFCGCTGYETYEAGVALVQLFEMGLEPVMQVDPEELAPHER